MAFKFENLKVWQKALDFSYEIHLLTRKFPKEELYVLVSQSKRAADSIALNIAEGSTGQTNKEFARFLGIAIRSALELVACLHLARKRNLIDETEFHQHYDKATEIVKVTQALRNSVLNSL